MSLIEFRNITRQIGSCIACSDVSLSIEKGHVHAIIGENGAGKSTLVKMLGGVAEITSGQIYLDSKNYRPRSAQDAFQNKIAFVHQHFVLAEQMTALDNLVLSSNSDKSTLSLKNSGEVLKLAEAQLKKFNWKMDLHKRVNQLSVGEQQRLEILKALMPNPEIIIFDEPTAVLSPQESDDLLEFILQLKQQGKTIILITHKLSEVKKVADRISVLRQGRLIETRDGAQVSVEEMAELMIGRRVIRESAKSVEAEASLLLELAHMNLKIHKGEILGVAGIEGNGQSELIQLLLENFKKLGLHYGDITEDRLKLSVFGEADLIEHMLLKHKSLFIQNGLINKAKLKTETAQILKEWDVRPQEVHKPLSEFSGGNQQKFMVGRELYDRPQVLLAAHPTRGVDLGAQENIHKALIQYSRQGHTVILISSDLDEVLFLSDRFVVLNKHQAYGPFKKNELNEQRIGLLMASDDLADLKPYWVGDI